GFVAHNAIVAIPAKLALIFLQANRLWSRPHRDRVATGVALAAKFGRSGAIGPVAGSPTVSLLFFARGDDALERTELGEELQALGPAFLSRRTARAFVGYVDSQVATSAGSVAEPTRCHLRAVRVGRQNALFPGAFRRGDDRNRTDVHGFAGRCVTTPPRRREREA
ncbi:MAG: hypothetical protein QOE44_1535, partial [Solirubrobacteraceae bacterium]|nr:hypothetical protein [Solirubrobacteraceae bacterium]